MIIQKAALDALLLDNVCEIRFARRIIKPGQAPTRRMLCTKSLSLLNSVNGRISLNYFPPKGPPKRSAPVPSLPPIITKPPATQ